MRLLRLKLNRIIQLVKAPLNSSNRLLPPSLVILSQKLSRKKMKKNRMSQNISLQEKKIRRRLALSKRWKKDQILVDLRALLLF